MAKENYIRPIDIKHGIIDMTHGAGGRATAMIFGMKLPSFPMTAASL